MTHKPKSKQQISPPDLGKMAPQATELEGAVLGALMIDCNAWPIVEDILTPDCFYRDRNRDIFQAVERLAGRSNPIDILTVSEELKNVGSAVELYYVVELSNTVASAANLEYHARILKQKALRRKMIEVCYNGLSESYEDTNDVFASIELLEKNVFAITHGAIKKQAATVGSLTIDVLKMADKAMESKGMTGVPSGLKALDSMTGGWQNTDLIIIAARPGMGKTALALECALYAAEQGLPALFFSCEMSQVQLVQRAMSMRSGVGVQNIRTGKLTDRDISDLKEQAENMQATPLYFDDTPSISITELRSKARKMVASKGVKMVVIDYLQLMTAKAEQGANRDNIIGEISRGLKAMAKELNIPVIALSQLSRAVESSGGSKRPNLGHLRESGNIEQDADIVLFPFRPDYYGITEDETGASVVGQCEAIFAKHRNGAVGSAPENMGFKGECTRFYNLSETQYATKPTPAPFTPQRPQLNDEDIPF